MKNLTLKSVFLLWSLFACVFVASAGSYTNNFDVSHDYVADGIIGDTNWDGVYLNFGDIPGGGAGGSGNGATLAANANVSFPGYFLVQSTRGDWAGAGDDGFFLYKIVSGDFDVSVQSIPTWNITANHFAGLLVRAYHTNNTGAPFSTTLTNNAENWVALMRGQEFGIFEVRRATNSADAERTFPDPISGTNDVRCWRIVRSAETNFTFFWKTNAADNWVQLTNATDFPNGVYTRSDLAGVSMQVGINQALFSGNQATAYFTDFELSGPNLNFGGTPPADPSDLTMSIANSNSLALSWTPGAGSDGSLVVVQANAKPANVKPAPGITYAGNDNFKNTTNSLLSGNIHIVYVGSGNSVTVTGLGGSNNTYYAAVYSYAGSGAATTYGLSPVVNSNIGPGTLQSVAMTLAPTNIPVGGVALATVTATFSSGDTINVTADPALVLSSVDSGIAAVGNGTAAGIAAGSTSVNADFLSLSTSSGLTVHPAAFTDEFGTAHDYVTNGVAGSTWDGIYLGAGDVPLQVAGNLGAQPGVTATCDANVSSNSVLTVVHRQTGWEGNESDGFLLFKTVPGDFQVAVHINSYDNLAFQFPGLMARLFKPSGGPEGTTNATFPNGRESYVRWMRFDEFGITTSARRNQNGGNQVFDVTDGETSAFWLLMVRQANSFTFYKRVNATDPWSPVPGATRTLNDATNGAAMQVGLCSSTFDSGANFRTVRFEHFMLDATNLNIAPPLTAGASNLTMVANNDGTMTVSWTPAPGSDGSLVVLRARANVNQQPMAGVTYTANAAFGQGSNLGSSNYVVYLGTGSSVVVSSLLPGTTYYAAIYSFTGTGPATSYNILNPLLGHELAIGVLQDVKLILSGSKDLLNGGVGAGFTVKAIYSGGITNDVTSQSTISSTPEGAVVGTNGVLSALTNSSVGPITVFGSYSGLSNGVSGITAHDPAYRDYFSVSNDYLAAGVTGTIWDGAYFGDPANFPANSVPGANTAGDSGATTVCDANISSNNILTVTHTMTDWAGAGDDGFLLFKYVPGDFQVAVHMNAMTRNNFHFAGLMARAFGNTNDDSGAAYNGAENWVYFGQFEEFGDSTESRYALNGADNEFPNFDGATNDFWLLIAKSGGNFNFYRKANPGDAWEPQPAQNFTRADLANVPMQVGLFGAMYTANVGTIQFENFILDAVPPSLQASVSGGNVNVSWPAMPGFALQSSGSLQPTDWQPAGGTSGITNGINTVTVPMTSTNSYFRLVK